MADLTPYELPDDIARLSDTDLGIHIEAATKSFRAESNTNTFSDATRKRLVALKDNILALREEQSGRLTAAAEAVAEIDALTAEVFGEPEPVAEPEPAVEAVTEAEVEPVAEAVTAAAVVTRRPTLDLSSFRDRQPRASFVGNEKPMIEIVASVDVPGYRPGQAFELDDVTEATTRRATSLKTAGGGIGLVASYMLPFEENMIVKDASSAPEGSRAVTRAADTRRLPGGSLVASGGWCAPSQTVYDITDVACPDGLWTAPEIQLERGGIRYYKTPTLDVNALTWVHTEADDIAGNVKPCFKIPCPAPVDVRCEAIGVCLESGILTERFFPELTSWYVRNAMVAHEIRVATEMYDAAVAASTPVVIAPTFGAFSAVYAAVALQVVDMIEKHHLCTSFELVFPFWLKAAFLADIARQQGVNTCDLASNCIESAFGSLPGNLRVQWARSLKPDVPTNIGGTAPALVFPADVQFLLYPSGQFQIGRGAEVSLGVIHDSTKFRVNDYTAMFSEECVALVDRGIESRAVTVPICPTGTVGAVPTTAFACPVA